MVVDRGEIWWAALPEPVGRRPVLLLSRSSAYAVRTSVTVAPLTRTIRSIPSEVKLGKSDGLDVACVVNLDDIQTIRKTVLVERVTRLSGEKLEKVAQAVDFSLGLSR